jgi:hypothetical protein
MGAEEMARANGLHACGFMAPTVREVVCPGGAELGSGHDTKLSPLSCASRRLSVVQEMHCVINYVRRDRGMYFTSAEHWDAVLRTAYHIPHTASPSCTAAAQCDVFTSVGGAGRKLLRLSSFLLLS